MELNQLNALPDGAKESYSAWSKLLDHPSYGMLLKWCTEQANECTQRLINATNWDQHCAQFGAKLAYESIINLKNSIEAEFTAIADEAVETATRIHFGETEEDNE